MMVHPRLHLVVLGLVSLVSTVWGAMMGFPVSVPAVASRSESALEMNSANSEAIAQFASLMASSAPTVAQAVPPLTTVTRFNHGRNVNAIAFSDDGQSFATAGGDRIIRVWSVNALLQGDERNYLRRVISIPADDQYVTSLAFSPEGRWLITGNFNGDVRIWDLNNCDPERPICASEMLSETDYLNVDPMVRFHPNQPLLAGSNYDGTVTLWDWANRTVRAVLEAETGAHGGDRLDGRFSSISFSPDGRFLVAGSHDKTLTIWDLAEEDLERLLTLETGYGVDAVSYSPTGEVLANSNLRGIELRPMEIRRGKLEVGEAVVLENHGRINTLTFSADGRYLFAGDNNGDISLWDVEEGEQIGTLSGDAAHSRAVLEVIYSPANNLFASGSADGSIRFWRLDR
ncbi:MAG: WD40 repeat domain-containing protein [Synechococcales bacterium]|nr:WD40 repeat domain-containing protein [Synechococcales bacterium]